jgi:hypothetical protein
MLSLTEEQITFIENDIKVRGITSPDLSIDLLDHICCLIEKDLDEYRNFDTVYQQTLLLFGEKGLKEIQDETNRLLTFKHYYFMNSTMKISGYVSSMLILIGSFFKFQHWPGANVMIVVGVFFLATLFLPILFILKFKSTDENNRSIVLSIIGFISSLLICVGILFRILHWPGARMMIVIGCVLLILGYLPIYILSIYKNTTNKINASATIILIIAGVGLIVTESGTGMSKATSDSFWRGVIESNEMMNYNKALNHKTVETMLLKDKTDSIQRIQINALDSASKSMLDYTTKMKAYLISITEDMTMAQAEKINLDDLRSSGWNDVLNDRLLSDEYAGFDYTAKKLKAKIEAYKKLLHETAPDIDLSNLNTEQVMIYGELVPWEKFNFEKLPLPLVIYNLLRIELSLQMAETAALNKFK